MNPVRVAWVVNQPKEVRCGSNPVWSADLRAWKTEDGDQREVHLKGYIKDLAPHKIFVECLCSALGRRLGLPIPEPLLVRGGPMVLMYGCVKAEGHTGRMTRMINEPSRPEVRQMLRESESARRCAVFDEYIGNSDRDYPNILTHAPGDFSFIDHEDARLLDMDSSEAADDNVLIRLLLDPANQVTSQRIKKQLRDILKEEHRKYRDDINLPDIVYSVLADMYSKDSPPVALAFLQDRINHVVKLVEERLSGQLRLNLFGESS